MSADEKKSGRRGVGRGRRQTPAEEQVPSRGMPETPASPTTVPGQVPVGRGRGRAAAAEAKMPPPEGSPENGSPKGSPHESDVEEKMKKLDIVDLAARPGFGVVGNKANVLVNYFEVVLDKELAVAQYEVTIKHERMKLNKEEKAWIFWTCVQQNLNVFKSPFTLLYDGGQICISLAQLKFGNGRADEATGHFEVRIRLMRMERVELFTVDFQAVGLVHVNMRDARSASATADRYTMPLQVLGLAFRQQRACPLDENTATNWFTFSNTVYKIPSDGRGVDLSAGRTIWQGLFGAARVGQGYVPYINFDVSHSGFCKPQSVLAFLVEVLKETFPERRHLFSLDKLTDETTLLPLHLMAFKKAMKGLKVRTQMQRQDGEVVQREYTVNAVADYTAETHIFAQRQQDGQERQISVAQYFAERYGALHYPKLNLLHVGVPKRNCFLPMEHCTIAYNQRVKKLNTADTSTMIKSTAISAPSRKQKVDQLVAQSQFATDPWLQKFGIRVNDQMNAVEARLLQPPKIQYARNGGGRQGPVVDVREGSWDMRGQKFYIPASCKRIGALVLDHAANDYVPFFTFLLRTCQELGMNVPASIAPDAIAAIPPGETGEIEKAMTYLVKTMGCEFIIVTLPQKGAHTYSEVKRVAEIVLGVMTQCVVKGNIIKCLNRQDRMTTTNIALKMNMKMGGINSLAQAEQLAKTTLSDPKQATLVLGIDVTHPSSTEKRMPSISSVVANVDDTFMRYAASIRVQKHRRESIVAGHLDQQVRQRLVEYNSYVKELNEKNNTTKPTQPARLIIFRDGVAEGQFQEVLREELGGIRAACRSLTPDYRPKITLIVAQKRHHTRFFPSPGGPSSGKAMNVRPGTVVDKDITHPEHFEFYLCSHFGIQGTSRPIRYHVLHDDNNLSSDHVQAMTFYLCHVYARCTRAVSIPAPVYYADLACRRARAHIFDKVNDFDSDTMSQRSGSGGETETAISEDELVNSTTVHDGLNMRMYFT